ncbi:uncharacterized protein LOC123539080 isoform X2 [Mercenaria mercenaria]|uniref:uncharacterized protein LOC123539080 isoform X2 n=1 Tax=Mercenaria mercenaria TaxID=6596 RepID=UPI00234E6DD5|nr:uncharacterized protein LOC123539080 isoform X2 [Mercenaria mercenaria]
MIGKNTCLLCFVLLCVVYSKRSECKSIFSKPNVIKTEDLEKEGWQMIFRATSGNKQSVYDAWTKGVGTNQDKPNTMERSRGLHYRDPIVSGWANLGIQYVKLALYNQDGEVAHVIFNGRGSDVNNWFDKKKIMSSSYSDLTSIDAFNIFSIVGDYRQGSLERRFLINRSYAGCDKDIGHIAVIDTKTIPAKGCTWDQHPVYPQFLYSLIDAADVWNRMQFGRADFMAVFIKTSN